MSAGEHFRASLRGEARITGSPLTPLVAHFAMARLLPFLMRPPHSERFALKGSLLLTVWQGEPVRATSGLDLHALHEADRSRVSVIISEACAAASSPTDGLRFELAGASSVPISDGERIVVPVNLGATRVHLTINVTFGHPVIPGFEWRWLSGFFREISPVRVRCYPMATVIAEKLALIVEFGPDNTRLIHLFDLWFLIGRYRFMGHDLQTAIELTFQHREAGKALQRTDGYWQAGLMPTFINRQANAIWQQCMNATASGVPRPALSDAIRDVAAFAVPLLTAVRNSTHAPRRWSVVTGWRERAVPSIPVAPRDRRNQLEGGPPQARRLPATQAAPRPPLSLRRQP